MKKQVLFFAIGTAIAFSVGFINSDPGPALFAGLAKLSSSQETADFLRSELKNSCQKRKYKAAAIFANEFIEISKSLNHNEDNSFEQDLHTALNMQFVGRQFALAGDQLNAEKYKNQAVFLLESGLNKAKKSNNLFYENKILLLLASSAASPSGTDKSSHLRKLNSLQKALLEKRALPELLKICQQKIVFFSNSYGNDSPEFATELNKTCLLLQSAGMEQEALSLAHSALQSNGAKNAKLLKGRRLVIEGNIYLAAGNKQKAKAAFLAALHNLSPCSETIFDTTGALKGLASIAESDKNFREGMVYLQKASKEISSTLGPNHRENGDILLSIAQLKWKQQAGRDISKELTAATKIFKDWKEDDSEIESLLVEANMLSAMGYPAGADDCLQIAKHHAETKRGSRHESMARILSAIGHLRLQDGNSEDGMDYLRQSDRLK